MQVTELDIDLADSPAEPTGTHLSLSSFLPTYVEGQRIMKLTHLFCYLWSLNG